MEQQATAKTPKMDFETDYTLNECRFKADLLYLAIAGLQRDDVSAPDDALASLQWMANGISVELTQAIERMEARNAAQ